MTQTLSGPLTQNYSKDQVVFLAGAVENDLYYIHSGKLMICVLKGSEVTPLSYLGPGEFLGELSFFDSNPRSATVIAVEESTLITIPVTEKERQIPDWLLKMAQSLTTKIRENDELIRKHGIKKKTAETIPPLSIPEQTHYYQVIKRHKDAAQA